MEIMNEINVTDDETIGLKKIIVSYFDYWKFFLAVFLLSLTLGVIYLIVMPKTYEMTARVQLQEDKSMGTAAMALGETAGLMKSFGLGNIGNGSINMDDELVKFLSNNLLEKMILELGINVNYNKPYAYKHYLYEKSPIVLRPDSLTNASLSERIVFNIAIKTNGKVEIEAKGESEKKHLVFDSLPAEIQIKEGSFLLSYTDGKKEAVSMKVDVVPAKWVADELAEQLTIEEYSKTSNVVEFVCQDYEKKRGIDMLNTLISLYNEQEDNYGKKEGLKSIDFLNKRINSTVSDLVKVEREIEVYKLENKMTAIEYDVQFYAEQMKDLQLKIIELEAQSHLVEMMSEYIKNPVNKYNLIPSLLSAETSDKSSPLTLYNEALLERSRIMQASETESPLIEKANRQVEQLRGSVFLSIENTRKSLNLTLGDLKKKEKMILDKMGKVPTLEKEYIDLKRQQEIYQGVYLILLQKKEEIALSIGKDFDKARVLDAAYVKEAPVGPRKLFVGLAIILFTLCFPVICIFVKTQILALREEYLKIK